MGLHWGSTRFGDENLLLLLSGIEQDSLETQPVALPLYRQSYSVIPAEIFRHTGRDTPFNRQSYSVLITSLVKLHLLVKRGHVWRVKLNRRHETSSKCVSAMKRLTSGNETFGICSQVYISSLQFLQIPHTEMKHNRTRAEHTDSWDSQELRY